MYFLSVKEQQSKLDHLDSSKLGDDFINEREEFLLIEPDCNSIYCKTLRLQD